VQLGSDVWDEELRVLLQLDPHAFSLLSAQPSQIVLIKLIDFISDPVLDQFRRSASSATVKLQPRKLDIGPKQRKVPEGSWEARQDHNCGWIPRATPCSGKSGKTNEHIPG